MKNSWKYALVTCLAALLGPAVPGMAKPELPPGPAVLDTTPRERQVARMVTRFVERAHYAKLPLDDALSEATLKTYIDTLDGNRHYFLQSDIAYFARYRNTLDDSLRSGDMDPVFDIFRLYRLRTQQNLNYALSVLDHEPDFSVDEDYVFDRKDLPWISTPAQMQDLWRRRVKNDALGLMLADKTWKETAEVLRKRYTRVLDRVNKLDSDDVFETFMNAFAMTLDPHSNYLSPRQSEEYKIQMSLSYEGIGASLQLDDEFVRVMNVIPGGGSRRIAASRQMTVSPVGQQDSRRWSMSWAGADDVVQKIRGPRQRVRLQILPGGAAPARPKLSH
jgi:carboxyl-terminal processing protease